MQPTALMRFAVPSAGLSLPNKHRSSRAAPASLVPEVPLGGAIAVATTIMYIRIFVIVAALNSSAAPAAHTRRGHSGSRRADGIARMPPTPASGSEARSGFEAPRHHQVCCGISCSRCSGKEPLFDRLAAVRCAFRCVALLMIRSGFGPSPANPAKMRSNTPNRLQRTKRLYNVLCGP